MKKVLFKTSINIFSFHVESNQNFTRKIEIKSLIYFEIVYQNSYCLWFGQRRRRESKEALMIKDVLKTGIVINENFKHRFRLHIDFQRTLKFLMWKYSRELNKKKMAGILILRQDCLFEDRKIIWIIFLLFLTFSFLLMKMEKKCRSETLQSKILQSLREEVKKKRKKKKFYRLQNFFVHLISEKAMCYLFFRASFHNVLFISMMKTFTTHRFYLLAC